MMGTIKLLKNGKVMRQQYFKSKPERKRLIKDWQSEVDRLIRHSCHIEARLSEYEISITLKQD